MKTIALGAVIACAFSTAAHAESYSGPYIGIEGGWDNYEVSADVDFDTSFDPDLPPVSGNVSADGISGDGPVGGAYIGYHLGMDSTFFAVEAFANFSGAAISGSFDLTSDGENVKGFGKVEARESYGAAARIGMKVNNSTGLYLRGGWVNTRFKTSAGIDMSDSYEYSETEDAIQYGAGLETMVGKNMSLRVEYLMADYGSTGLGEGISVDSNGVKAGLAFRF